MTEGACNGGILRRQKSVDVFRRDIGSPDPWFDLVSVQLDHTDPATRMRSSAALDRPEWSAVALEAKRLIDVAVTTVVLVIVLPFLALIAALVALTSPGPVLFKQQRVGRDGVPFTMLKFRTMQDGTHERVRTDPVLWQTYVENDFKLPENHTQVTRIGSLLRRSSLDELPQLVNVLRGEMSLVGVRPIEMVQYETRHEDSRRLYASLPPGLTGRWQVDGRSTAHHEVRVAIDDSYVRSWSLGNDLVLLARTPWALVKHHVHP